MANKEFKVSALLLFQCIFLTTSQGEPVCSGEGWSGPTSTGKCYFLPPGDALPIKPEEVSLDAKCAEVQGFPGKIENAEEQDFVVNMLNLGRWTLTGGARFPQNDSGSWTWADKSPITYNNWAQPIETPIWANYLYIYGSHSSDNFGKWVANNRLSKLLCEKSEQKIPTTAPAPHPSSSILESPRVTDVGDWGPWVYCDTPAVVVGMHLRSQPESGSEGDNIGLTAIRLACPNTPFSREIQSLEYNSGDWGEYTYQCPKGSYTIGFRLRSDSGSGKDKVGTTDLMMICNDGTLLYSDANVGKEWGEWTAENRCPENHGIYGFRTQVQEDQGNGADNTALNNVDMSCREME